MDGTVAPPPLRNAKATYVIRADRRIVLVVQGLNWSFDIGVFTVHTVLK